MSNIRNHKLLCCCKGPKWSRRIFVAECKKCTDFLFSYTFIQVGLDLNKINISKHEACTGTLYHLALFIDLQMNLIKIFSWIIVLSIIMRSSVKNGTYLSLPKCDFHFEGCLKFCSVGLSFYYGLLENADSKWSDSFLSCVEMRLLELHWRLSLFKNKVFCSQSFSLFLVNTYCFTHHQQLIQWTRRWGVVI